MNRQYPPIQYNEKAMYLVTPTSIASYLDLLFIQDKSNNIMTKLYHKCYASGFHIVNFPFRSSNIPSTPAFGVFASQLIHYARCCLNYSDIL